MGSVVIVDQGNLPEETWADKSRGSVRWKTLLSSDLTASEKIVCGISIMDAGETFTLHSHPDPELYFGLEGEVDVMIDGVAHRLKPGVALFIPGNAVHGVLLADQPVRWFYSFSANTFADIHYSFSTPAVAANANADLAPDAAQPDLVAAVAAVDLSQVLAADAVAAVAVVDVTASTSTSADAAAANTDIAIAANANADIAPGDTATA